MNILVLYQDIEGGTKNATEAIVRELAFTDPSNTYIIYKQPDIQHVGRFHYTRHLLWSTWNFWRVLQREKNIDIIYFTIFSAAVGKAFSRHRKTLGLFHFHGNQEFAATLLSERHRTGLGKSYNLLLGKIVNWLQQFAFRHASVVCFVSEFAKKQFLRYQGLDALSAKTRVVPNGVDTNKFIAIQPKQKRVLKIQKGFPSADDFLILFSGRIDEKKGIMYLVEALRFLPNRYKLIIVFPAMRERQSFYHYQALLNKITKSSLRSRVYFVENPSHIEQYYQVADCTVLPSEREYFSLVILESFACGTIFLGTSVGFIPEFLSDVDKDLIITSISPRVIANKIRWVSNLSQAERDTITRRGMDKARSFTWRAAAEAIVRELHLLFQAGQSIRTIRH